MISVNNKKDCCGCSACVQICPKQCISMKNDSEGFAYPIVDRNVCVECGLCEKVCPILNAIKTGDTVKNTYVGYAGNDIIREKSSSGGIFSLLADEVLNEGGIVFGAAFDDSFMVRHIAADSEKGLERLRGSKYLQSDIGDTFKICKQELDKGRKVLYTGTACQIAGLKSFLKNEYENLIAVDVLCHGVPTSELWKKYLNEQKQKYGSDVYQVSFRKKSTGWKKYSVEIQFANSEKYEKRAAEDKYMRLFLSDICLRPSCHDCKFKSLERASDITIGDSWGINNYMPEMDDDKGTSVILVHSEKGQAVIDNISKSMNIKKAETEYALPPTADSRKSVAPHMKREKFFELLATGAGIDVLADLLKPSFIHRVKRKIKSIIKK